MNTQLVITPQRDREALAKRVIERVDAVAVKLVELEDDIRALWTEFERLRPGETIAGCTTKAQFCQRFLHRTPRAVRYMLAGGNSKGNSFPYLASSDILPSDLTKPELDGQHFVVGSADDHTGHHDVYFMPAAAYTDFEGKHHEQGEYYHVGTMFTDRHAIEMERRNANQTGGASCEYTKRPLHRDFVRNFLKFCRLDHLTFEWEYHRCEGFERNLFWMSGDASWVESENVRQIKELEWRAANVFRIQRADLDLPYEVSKETTRRIEEARRRVEAFEAQADEIAELKKQVNKRPSWKTESMIAEMLSGKLTLAEAWKKVRESG